MWKSYKQFLASCDEPDNRRPIGAEVCTSSPVPMNFAMVALNPVTEKLEEVDEEMAPQQKEKQPEPEPEQEGQLRRLEPHEALTAAGAQITCFYPGGRIETLRGEDYNCPGVGSDNVDFDEDECFAVYYITGDDNPQGLNPHLPSLLVIYERSKETGQMVTRVIPDREYQQFLNHVSWSCTCERLRVEKLMEEMKETLEVWDLEEEVDEEADVQQQAPKRARIHTWVSPCYVGSCLEAFWYMEDYWKKECHDVILPCDT